MSVNILTHKRWCNHCKEHVNEEVHHLSCEFARLKMFKFTPEQMEFLVREELRDAYELNLKVDGYEEVDLELVNALLTVIQYYSGEKDFEEWKKKVDFRISKQV